jgi:hypothetical protein
LIEQLTDLPSGTLGFRASGNVSSEEYRQMMQPIYAALERGENSTSTSSSDATFTDLTSARSGKT